MSDDLIKVGVLARLTRLEMFAGHVADWAGNPLLHIKARALLEADAQIAEVPCNSKEPSDDIAKRMEALVDFVSELKFPLGTSGQQAVVEARAIKAMLEPVDADLVEAREVCEALIPSDGAFTSGEWDEGDIIRAALAAIRRGRALERDSREG